MDILDRVSLADQIAEVRREIAMRQKVYIRQVYFGKMTEAEAETHSLNMAAVLRTLETLRDARRDDELALTVPPVPTGEESKEQTSTQRP